MEPEQGKKSRTDICNGISLKIIREIEQRASFNSTKTTAQVKEIAAFRRKLWNNKHMNNKNREAAYPAWETLIAMLKAHRRFRIHGAKMKDGQVIEPCRMARIGSYDGTYDRYHHKNRDEEIDSLQGTAWKRGPVTYGLVIDSLDKQGWYLGQLLDYAHQRTIELKLANEISQIEDERIIEEVAQKVGVNASR